MTTQARTLTCYYCGGTGRMATADLRCQQCIGAGEVCILCHEPPRECECPSYLFDGEPPRAEDLPSRPKPKGPELL